MAKIIDVGIQNGDVNYILKIRCIDGINGIVFFIVRRSGGKFAATASVGFAKGLRRTLFEKYRCSLLQI